VSGDGRSVASTAPLRVSGITRQVYRRGSQEKPMIYPDEAPVFAAELAATAAYATFLQHLKDTDRDYDPDYTWVSVAGGVLISTLPAMVLARVAGCDWRAYERRVIVGFFVSALVIVPWQLWQHAMRKGRNEGLQIRRIIGAPHHADRTPPLDLIS
jgi:hypothetical protein